MILSAFEQDRDALLKNPVAAGFLDAQEEMHNLQHSVLKFVAETIELGRLPGAVKNCAGFFCENLVAEWSQTDPASAQSWLAEHS